MKYSKTKNKHSFNLIYFAQLFLSLLTFGTKILPRNNTSIDVARKTSYLNIKRDDQAVVQPSAYKSLEHLWRSLWMYSPLSYTQENRRRPKLRFRCRAFVKHSCFRVKAGKKKIARPYRVRIHGRRQCLLRIPNTAWGFQVTVYVRLLHILAWLPYLSKRPLFFYRLMTTRRDHFLA